MRVGWPFRDAAEITCTEREPDGRYSRIMVQRHIVQFTARHALVCVESIGRAHTLTPYLLFHIQNWQRNVHTGFWWRVNSLPLTRPKVDLVTGILRDLCKKDADELISDGFARVKALGPDEILP